MPNPDSIGAAQSARLDCLRFVLVEPSHVGNIGASARAVRSMGFARLYVVAPRDPGFRTAPEAVALATSAGDVLAQARSVDTLAEALDGVELAFATTGYARNLAPEPMEVRVAAGRAARVVAESGAQVALVFGPERTGLSNADVQRCHFCCSIPCDPVRGSLNLAQAVQVVAYEMRRALLEGVVPHERALPRRDHTQDVPRRAEPPAGVEQTEAMFAHLQQGLEAVGYLDPQEPKHLMARLRRLLLRAQLSATEVDIVRGIAAAMVMPRRLRAGKKSPR